MFNCIKKYKQKESVKNSIKTELEQHRKYKRMMKSLKPCPICLFYKGVILLSLSVVFTCFSYQVNINNKHYSHLTIKIPTSNPFTESRHWCLDSLPNEDDIESENIKHQLCYPGKFSSLRSKKSNTFLYSHDYISPLLYDLRKAALEKQENSNYFVKTITSLIVVFMHGMTIWIFQYVIFGILGFIITTKVDQSFGEHIPLTFMDFIRTILIADKIKVCYARKADCDMVDDCELYINGHINSRKYTLSIHLMYICRMLVVILGLTASIKYIFFTTVT